MKPWIDQYSPKDTTEVVGHPSAVEHILSLTKNWMRTSKSIFIWGEPGNGKTSCAVALAKELGYELIEINASDSRNKDAIESLVGGAVNQASLFGTKKIILVDEVDGLSGMKDRGGLATLVKVVAHSSFPIIITGHDPFDQKMKPLRQTCELVEFKTLAYTSIAKRLKQILIMENIDFEEEAVTKIAMSVGGDMRAAINDAQSAIVNGKLRSENLLLGEREQTDSMQSALTRVFKTTKADIAKGAFDRVDEDVDKVMMWVDQNLPSEYTKSLDLKRGFEALSDADKFLGRIRRWQYYRFYVYAYDLLTAGIATAKDEKYKGFTTYKQTSRPLMIWMANQKNAKKKAIAEKIAAKTHCSTKRARNDVAFLQYLSTHGKMDSLAKYYGLDKEELQWLKK